MEKGIISPGGVGYDINCGVRLLRTDISAFEFLKIREKFLDEVNRNVPSGVGMGNKEKYSDAELAEFKDLITKKLDAAKKEINLPLFCPCCSKVMKPHLDKRFYIQYKRCFNCQAEFETELKIKGLWGEYEKHIINSDIDGVINDFNIWIDEKINTKTESFIESTCNNLSAFLISVALWHFVVGPLYDAKVIHTATQVTICLLS